MIDISHVFYPVALIAIVVIGLAWSIYDRKHSEKWVKEGEKK